MSQGNNGLNAGPISANDLMAKLAKASKVMQKVDGGNFTKGNINTSNLNEDYEPQFSNSNVINQVDMSQFTQPTNQTQSYPVDINKIQNSKLPDAIKKAMMENPIQQISLSDSLDMDLVKGAKRLIEQENKAMKPAQSKQPAKQQSVGGSIDMNAIALMIENTVRKVMDEKLNQILTAQTTSSINENLVLKVGDSIFKGKITGVNKAK